MVLAFQRKVRVFAYCAVALATACSGNSNESGEVGGAGGGAETTGGAGGASSAGESPSLADIDLDLGGLNADMPEAPRDCAAEPTPVPPFKDCVSMIIEYNGETVEWNGGYTHSYVYLNDTRGFRAMQSFGPDDMLNVAFWISAGEYTLPPRTFEVSVPPDSAEKAGISVDREARALDTQGETSTVAASHDQVTRVAIVLTNAPWGDAALSEVVKGVFAYSLEPKPDCAPDAESLGCDRVRLRANFHFRSVEYTRPAEP